MLNMKNLKEVQEMAKLAGFVGDDWEAHDLGCSRANLQELKVQQICDEMLIVLYKFTPRYEEGHRYSIHVTELGIRATRWVTYEDLSSSEVAAKIRQMKQELKEKLGIK